MRVRPTEPTKNNNWRAAILIMLAGIIVYANSINGAFVFDDQYTIVKNKYIKSLRPLSQAVQSPSQSSVAGRPVTAYTLALNYAVNGLDVRVFHMFNIGVLIASALLLFGVVRRTLLLRRFGDLFTESAEWLALAVALLWVVHPLQTESVTYVVQRSESIAGMFYLASFYCFVRCTQASRRVGWGILSVGACALAMGAKEIAITAPFLILVYDRIIISKTWREVLRRWPLHRGLMSTWIVLYLLIRSGPRSDTAGFGMRGLTPLIYAKTQFGVILYYIRLSIFPTTLCIDYGWKYVRELAEWVPHMIAVLLLLCGTIYALKKAPAVGFVCASFFILLSPTSSFVPINDAAFEHRMYLPLAPLCVLAVLLGDYLIRRVSVWRPSMARAAGLAGFTILLLACTALGARTVIRNRDYATAASLWEATLRANPNNDRVLVSLGNDLLSREKYEEAIEMYRKASVLSPGYFAPYYGLATAMMKQGRFEEALTYANEAVRIDEIYIEANLLRGLILTKLRRLDEAAESFRRCLQIRPNDPEANFNLACIYDQNRQDADAERHYLAALRMDPEHVDASKQLADLYIRNGKPEQAIVWYQKHLRLAEPNAQELNRLATALSQVNRLSEAVTYYEQAIRLSPNQVPVRFNLGNTLARLGRKAEAVSAYREALRIDPSFQPAKDALGRIGATSQPG